MANIVALRVHNRRSKSLSRHILQIFTNLVLITFLFLEIMPLTTT